MHPLPRLETEQRCAQALPRMSTEPKLHTARHSDLLAHSKAGPSFCTRSKAKRCLRTAKQRLASTQQSRALLAGIQGQLVEHIVHGSSFACVGLRHGALHLSCVQQLQGLQTSKGQYAAAVVLAISLHTGRF
eukprot:scaffold1669_cov21-Tisochrysis_lutea.AAC.1